VKWSRYFFYAFIVSLPTQLSKYFWFPFSFVLGVPVDYLAFSFHISDILIIISGIFWFQFVFYRFKTKPKIFHIILLFSIGVLLVSSSVLPLTLISLFHYTEMVFVAYFVYSQYSHIKDKLYWGLLVGLVFSVALGLMQILQNSSVGGAMTLFGERYFSVSTPGIARFVFNGGERVLAYATLPHPNALAAYSVLCAIILMAIRSARFVNLTIVALLITQSLNAILSLAVSFVVSKTKSFGSVLVVFMFIVSFALPFTKNIHTSFGTSWTRRAEVYQLAMKAPSNVIFGSGLGTAIPFIAAQPFESVDLRWVTQPIHNIYLIYFIETGLAGMFLIYAGLFYVLKTAKNKGALYLMGVYFIMLTSLFDHYWITLQQNRLLLAVFMGVLFAKRSAKILHNEN